MVSQQPRQVIGSGGWRGSIELMPQDPTTNVQVLLESGERLALPPRLLTPQPDGSYYAPVSLPEARLAAQTQIRVVPVFQEELDIQKHRRETAHVTVQIVPQVRNETVEVSLTDEHVDIQRVPVGRIVSEPPPVRQDGDVTILPVLEEVLVVERRLQLKEEIHITRKRTTRQERLDVPLRSEEVHILRSDQAKQGT